MPLLVYRHRPPGRRRGNQKPRLGERFDPRRPLPANLLGFWLHNEGDGRGTTADLSPYGRGAAIGSQLAWRPGRGGTALFSSSAATDHATGGTFVTGFAYTAQFSIEALVSPDLLGGVFRAISRSANGGANGPGLYLANTNKFGFFDPATSTTLSGTTTPTAGAWYHVVATYDGATKRLYVNGLLEGTQAASFGAGSGNLTSFVDEFNSNFNGRIEYVRWWDRALAPNQVENLVADPYFMFAGDSLAALPPPVILPPMPAPGARASGGTSQQKLYLRWQSVPLPILPAMPLPGARLSGGTVKQKLYAALVPPAVGETESCWAAYRDALLAALAPPFTKAAAGPLGRLFSTVARELSACAGSVFLKGAEGRGNGSWVVTTRFEPIQAVPAVRRVDSAGHLLETYTVRSFTGRQITLAGTTPPQSGDFLQVDYTYLQEGLARRITEALAELNILTATGEFLTEWGDWFGVPRLTAGKYGSEKYGAPVLYGTAGLEADNQYSRRIIDRMTNPRNTVAAILAAVTRITGGSPYIVEWVSASAETGFIFKPTGNPAWAGDSNTAEHLIWGRTARFIDKTSPAGGVCVFEVWIPQGASYSTAQILQVVNSYKAAGTKAYVRYF